MIKAVCAEKAPKLLFSRLEPDRFIIPGLHVSSADSGNMARSGGCPWVWAKGLGLKVGIPGDKPVSHNSLAWCQLMASAPSDPAEPSAIALHLSIPGIVSRIAGDLAGQRGCLFTPQLPPTFTQPPSKEELYRTDSAWL